MAPVKTDKLSWRDGNGWLEEDGDGGASYKKVPFGVIF